MTLLIYGRMLRLVVLTSSIAFQAFPQEPTEGQDWAPLIRAVNAVIPNPPVGLGSTAEAAALRERVIRAYEDGEIIELTDLMLDHPLKEQAGEVIAVSLSVYVVYSRERIDDLVTIFMTSLALPDDRSDDAPRKSLFSDSFRYRLGDKVLGMLAEKGLTDDPGITRIYTQPGDWLREHLEAALGKFGTEVDAALARALKVIAETPPALRSPVPPGLVIGQPNTNPAPKLPAANPGPSTNTIKVKTSLQEEGLTSEQVSTWVMIPTALAAIGLLWLLVKRRA